MAKLAWLGAVVVALLSVSPAVAGAVTLVPASPPDNANFSLDGPTTFKIQDTPACPSEPGDTFLALSLSGAVNADGYFHQGTVLSPPGLVTMASDGPDHLKASFDLSEVPYGDLPVVPGQTLHWGAACWSNTGDQASDPHPTPIRKLNVVAGSRVKPPSLSELGVTITDPEGNSDFTRTPQVKLQINAPEFSSGVTLSNDGGFGGGSATLPRNPSYRGPPYDWGLLSSGPERLPKTVYVRFPGDYPLCFECFRNPAQTFTDDIILDQTPPKVQSAEIVGGSGSASSAGLATAAKRRSVKLRIKAKDKTSGVEEMQITGKKRKPGDLIPFEKRAKAKVKGSKIFVRVLDGAGNESRWERAVR